MRVASSDDYRGLAESAWGWVRAHERDDDGPWFPWNIADDAPEPTPAEDRDCLYQGIAGLAPLLAEISLQRALSRDEVALRDRIVHRLERTAATRAESSLYDGLGGDVTALRMLAPGREVAALQRLAALGTPSGWETTFSSPAGPLPPLTDIIGGSAGIVMVAIWAGGPHAESIATTGGEMLLATADRTEAGLDWGMWPGSPSRGPNYSHGTAGVSAALAVAGAALGRPDFVDAAVLGAQHLLSVGSLDDGGFVVPHTIPPANREVEPVTYTWCHGPAGTSHLFTALAAAGVDRVDGHSVADLRVRCLHSILTSGVPQRLRPGFWDNDGRCCGTAGVGDVLLDAYQDADDVASASRWLTGARTMADAIVERAITDGDGARWRFVEYRQDPPLLPPGTSWMQGAAGIAAYLFRLARVVEAGPDAPVVDRPDEWWAVPPGVRSVRSHAGDSLDCWLTRH